MKNKKFFCAAVTLLTAVALASCGTSTPRSEEDTDRAPTPTQSEQTFQATPDDQTANPIERIDTVNKDCKQYSVNGQNVLTSEITDDNHARVEVYGFYMGKNSNLSGPLWQCVFRELGTSQKVEDAISTHLTDGDYYSYREDGLYYYWYGDGDMCEMLAVHPKPLELPAIELTD